MKFRNDRLVSIRNKIGINKAEAARRLNMSAMGYGRYEKGEREPSYQTVCFIAEVFGTTPDYLYGKSEIDSRDSITVSSATNPALFELVSSLNGNEELIKRLLSYANKLK